VCMATHGRGHVGPPVLGSVAEELLRRLAVPFVLVGPRCAEPWPDQRHRLVACLDESERSEAVLDVAAPWARSLGWELWLTEVLHPRDAEGARHPDRYVDTVVERLGDPRIQTRVAFASDVPHAILHVARAQQAAMLAMGTHGRSGLDRLVLGSVTMEVVHRAVCPVLVMRPR
jgi:nucleotide-binding universal stress UspA family protein